MNTRLRIPLPALLAVTVLVTTACAGGLAGRGAGTSELYVWKSGTAVTYEVRTEVATSIEVPGGGTQASAMVTGMTVAVVATGPRRFEVTISDAFSDVGAEVAAAAMAPDITTLNGLTSSVTLDERGKVAAATGLEGNSYIAFAGGPQNFIETTLQGVFQYLPESDLEPGTVWERTYGFPFNIMGLGLDYRYTDEFHCLEETVEAGLKAWSIGVSSRGGLAGSGDMQGTTVDFSLSGNAMGTIVMAADSGMILQSDSTMDMNGGISAGGMDIPMTMRIKITVRRK
jgi:hypothetical protein